MLFNFMFYFGVLWADIVPQRFLFHLCTHKKPRPDGFSVTITSHFSVRFMKNSLSLSIVL